MDSLVERPLLKIDSLESFVGGAEGASSAAASSGAGAGGGGGGDSDVGSSASGSAFRFKPFRGTNLCGISEPHVLIHLAGEERPPFLSLARIFGKKRPSKPKLMQIFCLS
jgi:hypothetical protein